MLPLTKEEKESYRKQEIGHILKKSLRIIMIARNILKLKIRHYTDKYRGAAHDICNLRYLIPKEIPIVFHKGAKYDHGFITKALAEEFKGEFQCLGGIERSM